MFTYWDKLRLKFLRSLNMQILMYILYFGSLAQPMCLQNNPSISVIDSVVSDIDNDASLSHVQFDGKEVWSQTFDGGAEFDIWSNDSCIRKISSNVRTSYGMNEVIIYLDDNIPIKFIETEYNFPIDSSLSFDFSKLIKVYQYIYYVHNWDMDLGESFEEGKRVLSEGSCAIYEFEPLIDKAHQLLSTKRK